MEYTPARGKVPCAPLNRPIPAPNGRDVPRAGDKEQQGPPGPDTMLDWMESLLRIGCALLLCCSAAEQIEIRADRSPAGLARGSGGEDEAATHQGKRVGPGIAAAIDIPREEASWISIEDVDALHRLYDPPDIQAGSCRLYHPPGQLAISVADTDGDGGDELLMAGRHSHGFGADHVLQLRSGRTGEVLDELSSLRVEIAIRLGDVDGDGAPDFAATPVCYDRYFDPPAGSFTVYSGASRVKLHDFGPPHLFDADQRVLARAGDLDGDGVDDLLVGSPGSRYPGAASEVFLCSGADGRLLRSLCISSRVHDAFGAAICAGADFDGDGIGDLCVGAPLDERSGLDNGAVWIFSGADGSVVERFLGSAPGGRLGASLAWIDDVDGDGRAELLVGTPGGEVGHAYLISSKDRCAHFSWRSERPLGWFGSSVCGAPDLDGDGVSDLAVGAPGSRFASHSPGGALVSYRTGGVVLLSGADGSVLGCLAGPEPGWDLSPKNLGHSLDAAGDLDADGHRDLIIGAPGQSDGYPGGVVYVLSGRGLAQTLRD